MKADYESRDWDETRPDERMVQLSPFQCSLLEAALTGRTVVVHGTDDRPPIEFAAPKA